MPAMLIGEVAFNNLIHRKLHHFMKERETQWKTALPEHLVSNWLS